MISAGEFRNGVTFEMDSQVYKVVEFQHVKPGKGSAFVRTKLKNVINGSVLEKTFNPTEKVENAQIERRDMQYLFHDGDFYNFMDITTYEQLPLTKEELGDTLNYLIDNMNVKVLSYKGKVFGIEPPIFVELEVTYTEPGFKGNTSTGTYKPATLQTGYIVNVPLFVNIGDKIRIDTRTGEYMDRV
jgi:elongation factor P